MFGTGVMGGPSFNLPEAGHGSPFANNAVLAARIDALDLKIRFLLKEIRQHPRPETARDWIYKVWAADGEHRSLLSVITDRAMVASSLAQLPAHQEGRELSKPSQSLLEELAAAEMPELPDSYIDMCGRLVYVRTFTPTDST